MSGFRIRELSEVVIRRKEAGKSEPTKQKKMGIYYRFFVVFSLCSVVRGMHHSKLFYFNSFLSKRCYCFCNGAHRSFFKTLSVGLHLRVTLCARGEKAGEKTIDTACIIFKIQL